MHYTEKKKHQRNKVSEWNKVESSGDFNVINLWWLQIII